VQIAAKTDVGLVRKRNEDFFIIGHDEHLVILCDGMGGHPGGDLASRMAAEEVERVATGGASDVPVGDLEQHAALRPFANLIRGVFAADLTLRTHGRKNAQFHGMGTTLVAVQEHDGILCAAHVGDSRLYCFRDGVLQQLTQDHSYVATLPESARASFAGIKNILTRAVGVGEDFEVDFTLSPAAAGETYLLCTDGLHNFVDESRIVEVLSSESNRARCVDILVEDAKKGGGGDNITLAVAWIEKPTARPAARIHGVVGLTSGGLHAQVAS